MKKLIEDTRNCAFRIPNRDTYDECWRVVYNNQLQSPMFVSKGSARGFLQELQNGRRPEPSEMYSAQGKDRML